LHKPRVLTLVGYYLPGFKSGGPIRTISNMVEHLGDELDFYIITADRDFQDHGPYPDVPIDRWVPVGKAHVFYASPGNRSLFRLARIIRDRPHDVMYVNSFFHPSFTLAPLLARRLGLISTSPTVIAPRGELSGGAWMKSRWKKRPFVALARAIGLYRNLTWQASSPYEAEDIRRVMRRLAKHVAVVPNLPAPVDVSAVKTWRSKRTPGGGIRVCFIGRIVPWKNLDFALRVLALATGPVEFNIYGYNPDAAYWDQCERLMGQLPAHVTARFHGPLAHEHVGEMLARQDLLLFPTKGENFGHVIYEALSAGLPVLISDKTPWRDLEAAGVGWDLSLESEDRFLAALESQLVLTEEDRDAQRARALAYAQRVASDPEVRANNIRLFTNLCTPPPGT